MGTRSVTFVFTFTIDWEPEDFDTGVIPDDEQLIQNSKDNLIDCMRDWLFEGGPLRNSLAIFAHSPDHQQLVKGELQMAYDPEANQRMEDAAKEAFNSLKVKLSKLPAEQKKGANLVIAYFKNNYMSAGYKKLARKLIKNDPEA